ncbi:carbon-nitrogen hydrolase family protein [Labrys neptuniae]
MSGNSPEMSDGPALAPRRDNSRFLIAGIQMPVPVTGQNIAAMTAQLEKTVVLYPGVDMVVFSELAPHGPLHACAAVDPQADEAHFQALAAKHRIWIIPGSYFVERNGKIYNHTVVINPAGEIAGRYDKMFPFLPFEAGVTGGSEFLIFDVPGVGRFGLSICYDIWFPETTRTLTSAGVEVLIHPVLTGTTDRDAELAIVRATATMFSCYVVDVNGLDGGGVGRSLVVDPTGVVVHQCGQATEIFPITLDLGLVRQVRAEGANGLGQVLKSFRDKNVALSTYADNGASPYLDSLGPLIPMRKRDWL